MIEGNNLRTLIKVKRLLLNYSYNTLKYFKYISSILYARLKLADQVL